MGNVVSMKKYIKLSFILSMCVISLFSGCKKYEEGPSFSLSSKKSRLTNTWKFVKVFDVTTSEDLTADFEGSTMEFQKDGTINLVENGMTETDTWKFTSDKEEIAISLASGGSIIWKIRKLAGKEFWFRDDVGTTDSYEYQLEPK